MIFKDQTQKEFICRQCGIFLEREELKDGKCPICNTDEDLFFNDKDEEV